MIIVSHQPSSDAWTPGTSPCTPLSALRTHSPEGNVRITENQYDSFDEFLADVDMVVVMVKHDHIKQNWDKLKGKVILDRFNICPLEGISHLNG